MRFQGLQRGREGQKEELGVLIGMIRRRLSVVAVKAQAELLLNRIEAVGGILWQPKGDGLLRYMTCLCGVREQQTGSAK